MIKLLIGGSPCTHWSIAKTKNRETEPSGIGWELFENYLIAKDKFQPDYFLYENNKSMSKAIREEITKRFGFEPICINSALGSAQNRQRLYWCGKRNPNGTYSRVDVEQPEDRGILLRDILETGVAWREKSYTLDANYYKTAGVYNPKKQHSYSRLMAAEPVGIGFRNRREDDGKLYRRFETHNEAKANRLTSVQTDSMVAEPVRIGTIESAAKNQDFDSQQYRVYSADGKSVTICGNGGGVVAKTGLYACPCESLSDEYYHGALDGNLVGMIENPSICRNGKQPSQQYRVYTCEGKSVCVDQDHRKHYIVPANGKETPIYEVRNGLITIKGKHYPIKLANGFYIIRKLTVTECKRLQTVPDTYDFPVSNSQAYKMLGNGWTVDVIVHLLSHCQGITTEPVDVLSMYDGMACGHIALNKLGATVQRYRATEIDKYAIKTACHNFPDIEQLGDAFLVREW